MNGLFDGWTVGRVVMLGMVLSNIPTVQLSAQVGHDPGQSPYRDVQLRSGPVLFVGRLSGDRGRAGPGLSNALTFGARYEFPAGQSILLQFTAAYLQGDRFIIDPRADSTSPQRRTGPVDASAVLTEIQAQLRLTGAKSWHGIAPYAGVGLGLMYDAGSPGDTTGSGYTLNTKFTLSGATGVRLFPSRRLIVNADVRAILWRLRYPISFHTPANGDGSRVIPLTEPLTDWTLHPWVSLGIGWTF